jgi:hypothetical protein
VPTRCDAGHTLGATRTNDLARIEPEREFYGKCRGGDDEDQYQIALMYDSHQEVISGADMPRYDARLRSRTRCLVRRHRRDIERVAALLQERGILQPDEIDAAVSGAAPVV